MNRHSKTKSQHDGFTLVELLICMLVLGIISARMLYASTEAITTAKVNDIVNTMKTLKMAALEVWADNQDELDTNYSHTQNLKISRIIQLLPMTSSTSDWHEAKIAHEIRNFTISGWTGCPWYVIYRVSGTEEEKQRIRKKLAARAASLGLFSADDVKPDNKTHENGDYYNMYIQKTLTEPYTENNNYAAMRIR